MEDLSEDFRLLREAWPSAWVARSEIGRFSGGVISARYMANLDSRGLGVSGRIRVGRKVVYPMNNLISWLQKKATKIGPRNET